MCNLTETTAVVVHDIPFQGRAIAHSNVITSMSVCFLQLSKMCNTLRRVSSLDSQGQRLAQWFMVVSYQLPSLKEAVAEQLSG